MIYDEPTYEMACQVMAETEKAIRIKDFATGELLWLPLSQIKEIHRDKFGIGTVVMTEWIAKQKGLT